jgi:hypothetical protein
LKRFIRHWLCTSDDELRRCERLDEHRSFPIADESRPRLNHDVAAIADVRDPNRTTDTLDAATLGPLDGNRAIHGERHHLHRGGTPHVGSVRAIVSGQIRRQGLEDAGDRDVHVGLLATVGTTLQGQHAR